MNSIIFVPLKDYFGSRKKLLSKFLLPFSVACISMLLSLCFNIGNEKKISSLFNDFVNTQINIVAILISFSVAIITILVSADNKNIQELKNTESKKELYKPINHKQLTLFQVLLSNIAYNIIIEIFYLICLIAISLMQAVIPISTLKYITAICIFIILHILVVLLESVSQMYLTFWNKK